MLAITRITIPPPNRPPHLLLFARWKDTIRPSQDAADGTQRHVYELAILPDEPIVIGRRVKILALSPIAHCSPQVPSNQFDTYDPHVVGRIEEVVRRKGGRFQAKIGNVCRGNAVVGVDLEYPDLREAFKRAAKPQKAGKKRAASTVEPDDRDEAELLSTPACVRPWPTESQCRGAKCRLTPGPSEFMYI